MMRSLYLVTFACLLLAISCRKTLDPVPASLIGAWEYTENYYSAGGPGSWHPVTPSGQKIEFRTDGTFIPCETFLKGATHFATVDSVTIRVSPVATALGSILLGFKFSPDGRELHLYPVDPICIEGCDNKFRRR
jgi:hypothetical protein